MEDNFRRLQNVRQQAFQDDLQMGPPECRVRVVGDPEIIDALGRKFHYFGPALLINFDDRGMVRTVEFVGVRRDNDYISEVWQLDVRTARYKYRNLEHTQGISVFTAGNATHEPQFQAGDMSWSSEKGPDAIPPRDFFQHFKVDSETFFVDCRSGMFVRGPKYGMLKSVLKNPSRFLKSLFGSCSMAPEEWMKLAAQAIALRRSQDISLSPCREMQAVQVAQLTYGLATSAVVVA